MLLLNIARWALSVALLLDGILFIWMTALCCIDMKRNPAQYANSAPSRLSYRQLLTLFGGAGVVCLLMLFVTVPL